MKKSQIEPVIQRILVEKNQGHETRIDIYEELEKILNRPVVSFFTSFRYPVIIEDKDAEMLEAVLQKTDLSNGFALLLSSPGGSGLAAERIINICRRYSEEENANYWAIVPCKAKSAATMICFGAEKIIMSKTSELGPVDPQIAFKSDEADEAVWTSAYNVVKSYENLFERAERVKGNLEPYLQQLANYIEWQIEDLRSALSLSVSIAVETLSSGMMKGKSDKEIKEKIEIFLFPEQTKVHGRPIFYKKALDCGLNIELVNLKDESWELIYELYLRIDNLVSSRALKCIETKNHSFVAGFKEEKIESRKK